MNESDPSLFRLAIDIIQEHFGSYAKFVAEVLTKGPTPLDKINRFVGEKIKPSERFTRKQEICRTLAVLQQHNLLEITQAKRVLALNADGQRVSMVPPVKFSLKTCATVQRLRFPKALWKIRQLYGGARGKWADAILSRLFFYGRACEGVLITDAITIAQTEADRQKASQKNDAADADAAAMKPSADALAEVFQSLVTDGYITRVPALSLARENRTSVIKSSSAKRKTKTQSKQKQRSSQSTTKPKTKRKTPASGEAPAKKRSKKSKSKRSKKKRASKKRGMAASGAGAGAIKWGQAKTKVVKKEDAAAAAPVSSLLAEAMAEAEDTELLDAEAKPKRKNGGAAYCVDMARFSIEFRRQAVSQYVSSVCGGLAGAVFDVVLDMSMDMSGFQMDGPRRGAKKGEEEPPDSGIVKRVKFPSVILNGRQVHEALKRTEGGAGAPWEEVFSVLCSMSETEPPVLERLQGGAHIDAGIGGEWRMNDVGVIRQMQETVVEDIILEKFGKLCCRVFRLVREHHFLDEKQVGQMALLPPKTARRVLYQLFRASMLRLQEVPKKADHSPMTTFYLWTVPMDVVLRTLRRRLQKAMLNLRLRRAFEYDTNQGIVQRFHRKLITEGSKEYDAFIGFGRRLHRLDLAVMNLDDTVMLMCDF